jgi:hypothetical protein
LPAPDLLQITDVCAAAVGCVLDQDFAVADDRIERRAQLVAHIGEEGRLVRDAASASAAPSPLHRGPREFRGVVAEHGERPACSPSSSGPTAGSECEFATGDGEHAGGELGQPPCDVAEDEQPDDQSGDDETCNSNQDEPQPALGDGAGGERRGIGRFALGAFVQLRHLIAQIEPDRLQRRLIVGDGVPFRQELRLDGQQAVAAVAQRDQRLGRGAKLGRAGAVERGSAVTVARSCSKASGGGELARAVRTGRGSAAPAMPLSSVVTRTKSARAA